MIVSMTWFQGKPFTCHYSDLAKNINGDLLLEHICINEEFGPHMVDIFTNILDHPIIKISFWTKKQAAKCTAGLRKLP